MAIPLDSLLMIDLSTSVTLAWLLIGTLGWLVPRRLVPALLFPASALAGLLLAVAGLLGMASAPQVAVLC